MAKSKKIYKQPFEERPCKRLPEDFVWRLQLFKPDADWHFWRPDLHSEIVERALDQLGVSGGEREKCRDTIGWVLRKEPLQFYHANNEVVVTWLPLPNKQDRRALRNLVNALEDAQMALGALRPQWQEVLFASPEDKAEIGEAGSITWPLARERLDTFRTVTAKAADLAEAYEDLPELGQVNAGPGELDRRSDARKRHAANCAYELLVKFGKTPTLTPDGPFFNLASILYEAFSGVADKSIERQCRWTFELRADAAQLLRARKKESGR